MKPLDILPNLPCESYFRGNETLIVFFPTVKDAALYPNLSSLGWAKENKNADFIYLSGLLDVLVRFSRFKHSSKEWDLANSEREDIKKLADGLKPLLINYSRIIFYGFDIGAYVATFVSRFFEKVNVITESPQFFVTQLSQARSLVNIACDHAAEEASDLEQDDGCKVSHLSSKKVFIWGSCVTRDAFSFLENDYIIKAFISRKSLATGFSREIRSSLNFIRHIKEENLTSRVLPNYFIRSFEEDLLKQSEAKILNAEFDVFILDLIDERFRIAQVKEGFYTYSTTAKKSGYPKVNKVRLFDFDSDLKFKMWKQGVSILFELLLRKKCHIILNKVYWVESEGEIPLGRWDIDSKRQNKLLDRMYSFIEDQYGSKVKIISYPRDLLKKDPNHRWGEQPIHYTQPTYAHFIKELDKLCSNERSYKAMPVKLNDNMEEYEKNIIGYYQFSSFPSAFIGTPIDWSSNPYGDRTWQWSLHSFLFFDHHINSDTGRVYEESQQFLRELLKNWLLVFGGADALTEFPWHDHATAIRLDKVMNFYNALLDNDLLDEETEALIRRFSKQHCDKLSQDSFYSRNTNHGYDQALSLFQASSVFGFKDYRKLALQRLFSELQFAFTDEGVHVENSPGYHKGMIFNVLRAFTLLNKYNAKNEIHFDLELFLDKALEFLMYCLRYDYRIVYIGDTSDYSIQLNLEDFKGLKQYNNFMQLSCNLSLDKHDQLPLFKLYEKSGYFFYRSDWSDIKNSTHIILKSGYSSSYHRQDDDLNILFSALGEDWLIDSGLYSHNQKDPKRIYMRSAKAHNVPVIDGVSFVRSPSLINTDTSIAYEETPKNALCSVIAKTHMYLNTPIRRRLTIFDELHFGIRDLMPRIIQNDGHWVFHVPADKTVSIVRGNVSVKGRNGTMVICPKFVNIKDKVKKKVPYRVKIYKGWNDEFPSIFSRKPNQVIDTQAIVFTSSSFSFVDFDIMINDGI